MLGSVGLCNENKLFQLVWGMRKNPIRVPIRVRKTNEMTVEVGVGEELVFLVPGTNWGWEWSQRIITIKQVGTKLVRLF